MLSSLFLDMRNNITGYDIQHVDMESVDVAASAIAKLGSGVTTQLVINRLGRGSMSAISHKLKEAGWVYNHSGHLKGTWEKADERRH